MQEMDKANEDTSQTDDSDSSNLIEVEIHEEIKKDDSNSDGGSAGNDNKNKVKSIVLHNRLEFDLVESLKSDETIVFESKMVKTSTKVGELITTWNGTRSNSELSRRRTQSWSGDPRDDGSSEVRILRERLVRTQARPRPAAVRFLSRRQRLTLASLALVDFMSFCSMSIMAPFFPREASNKGLSDVTCGLVFGFYAIVMFLTSPLFGKFLPAVGAKLLFLSGIFMAGACNILFGTLAMIEDTTTFTALCFLVRGLEALGASAYSTASYVFVINAFPESIGTVLGILETFVGLGMSVGPAIGGLLYSIGGFGLPFYSLGVVMVAVIPINVFLLSDCEEYMSTAKSGSVLRLFTIPSIIITGLVIVIVSNTWAFLDPTLEPHLRQFGLSTNQIGLIFLLFSSLYGIFSPIWGWVADRVHNHWCMMVWGLFLSTIGLLLLGPCPFIPGLSTALWLDLVALSILGISVALTLLPTFQGVLTSSIYEGGCPEALPTYSAVAGVWSCCYSLGEVLGPALGGAIAGKYGFPLCATLCGAACFIMAVVTLAFFSLRESNKLTLVSPSLSDSIPYSDTTWNSAGYGYTRSAPDFLIHSKASNEQSPLITPCGGCMPRNDKYRITFSDTCFIHKNKTGSASVKEAIAYILMFKFLSESIAKFRNYRRLSEDDTPNANLYQNYLENDAYSSDNGNDHVVNINNNKHSKNLNCNNPACEKYCTFLEQSIFGSPGGKEYINKDEFIVKSNNTGLIPTFASWTQEKQQSEEILRHNVEKVSFYENQSCNKQEACDCRNDVTNVKATIGLSVTGACEV